MADPRLTKLLAALNSSTHEARELLEAWFQGDADPPRVDPRDHESIERLVVDAASSDARLLTPIEKVLEDFFGDLDRAIDPGQIYDIYLPFLYIATHLGVSTSFATIRAWYEAHRDFLHDPAHNAIGRSTLEALASMQSPRQRANVEYWQTEWDRVPVHLKPIVFMALRRCDVRSAVEFLPKLIEVTNRHNKDPKPLIRGLADHEGGRHALIQWRRDNKRTPQEKKLVREVLRPPRPLPPIFDDSAIREVARA